MICELWAPAEFWELPEVVRNQYKCGPGRGILEKLVPDVWYFGVPFVKPLRITPACRIHDYMYQYGPDEIWWKEKADRALLNNMIRMIEFYPAWRIVKSVRYKKAAVAYQAVKIFGGPAFWAGRNPKEERHIECFA